MRRLLSIGFFSAAFLCYSRAWGGAGTDGANFLNIPIGARPAALGGSYTALATDAYAPTWNPGGLGFVDAPQLSGQHLSYLESIHYEYLSFVIPFKKDRAWGGSVQYLGSGDIAGTSNNGDSTGSFSSHYAAYSLAYGQKLSEAISLGATAKVINAKISDVSATAYAGDVGLVYRPAPHWTFASAVTNMGTQLTFLNDGGSLPLAFKTGAAYQPTPQWTVTAEGVYLQTGLYNGHAGVEWRPIQYLALRAGYRSDTLKALDPTAGVSAGFGLQIFGQELAYAWVPYGQLGNTQYFSLLIRFEDRRGLDRKNLIQYRSIQMHRVVQKTSDKTVEDPLLQLLSDQDRDRLANHFSQLPQGNP